ncbi:hypothetical protein HD597_005005 [Nonomuraea thailandensis]|uniref:Uncharacterized protein n=1 Tax=Nonomuraea thailandensis TaxID=1188745 RepID=A0A9X2K3C5_9ACTN|nr:DUF6461 domain-containing protein [Nonomuraea thailandensis]MCP2357985.1 hypothetical protein [Nonomuraea thailandensis]
MNADQENMVVHVAWCQGLSTAEVARRLRAEPGSAHERRVGDIGVGVRQADEDDGAVLIGPAGTWSVIRQVQGWDCTRSATVAALSDHGGQALGIGWDVNGNEPLLYAVDGRVLVRMDFNWPDDRQGADPHALDPYLDGVEFGDPDDVEENTNAALTLIGRVTGHPLDRARLDATHIGYVIPADAW